MSASSLFGRLKANERKILAGLAAATFLALILACFFKYAIFEYDGMDLAIFNQIFWNTVRGRPFALSIHPHPSLGDHAELAVLLLAPVYALVQDPRTLLLLQAAAVVAPAFAVLALARTRLASAGKTAATAAVPFALACAWLLNPSVLNIALFEFHMLPFALLPLLLAVLAYARGRKRLFIVCAALAMLVREDVAMVVAALGILAWMERRSWWWRAIPLAMGAAWFAVAMRIIASFAPADGYKYAIYYRWLGDSPLGMLANAAADPLRVLTHVLTVPNLEMVIGLLMPLAFLPIARPKALVLAIGPLLQILLGAPGGGEIILETHYATLLLPAVFLAAVDGADRVLRNPPKLPSYADPGDWPKLVYLVLGIAAIFSWASLGPFPGVVEKALRPGDAWARAAAAEQALARIPADAPVAASYRLLPALSSRESVYSAHYLFLGVTQFAEGEYPVPADLRYAVLDVDDLTTYRAQFLPTLWTAPYFPGGHDRLMAAIGGPILHRTPFSVHEVGAPWPAVPPPTGSRRTADRSRWPGRRHTPGPIRPTERSSP
jgi:uncharacterized membrane protein